MRYLHYIVFIGLSLMSVLSQSQTFPNQQEGTWTAKNFQFHTGEIFPELTIGYTTLGNPSGIRVLILHGTGGTGKGMLSANFAGQLFGPGQPLDAQKYFIILPDAIGVGRSSKPSNGLRMKFPAYNYNDMVQAQYRLVTEGLGVKHLSLVMGNSMGGMQAWLWGIQYPLMMDKLVPMASTPIPMSGRNWLMRRLLTQTLRNDPQWQEGNYVKQPQSMALIATYFSTATSGGTQHFQKIAPTSKAGDAYIQTNLAEPFTLDANDFLYQWESSSDFDPSAGLEKIQAKVLVINSEDDERNPPILGLMEKELKRIPHAKLYLIPASTETTGHGTTANAKWYAPQLREFLNQ